MHQAGSLAQYAFDNQVGKLQDVFVPLMGGICVAYARPFLRADGLGPLDEKYAKLSESAMQETHDDLLRIRHTLYAHRDLTRTIAWNPATQTSEAMHGVTLFFDGRHEYTFATHEPTYRDINLPAVILLCEHQRARIAVDRHKVVDKLCRGVCPPRGTYELGIQFPIPRKKG
jgi:hypothetical protein